MLADDRRSREASSFPADPHQRLDADIVMKGGITSGVVYPLAVVELAQAYRFRSIGGASAGAIAAAATAAAEYGRQTDKTDRGFTEMEHLPGWLGQHRRVLGFSQPQPETAAVFCVAIAFVGSARGRLWRVPSTAVRTFPLAALAGLLPPIAIA